MAHGDAREGQWGGHWRTKWVASSLHTTSEHGVTIITTADAHKSAASSLHVWRASECAQLLQLQRTDTWLPQDEARPVPNHHFKHQNELRH